MQDLPPQACTSSGTLPEEHFFQWLCTFEEACVQQNVERISMAFIERNIMTILREVDDWRARIVMGLKQAAEMWRSQRINAQPEVMNLQQVNIRVPAFLSKACEALASASKFVDVVVKGKCRGSSVEEDAMLHRAVRAMHFGTCIPLLMRVASLVSEVAPTVENKGVGSGGLGGTSAANSVVLPSAVAALAESARGATSILLKSRVGSRTTHFLHLGKDMMKACEGAARHLQAVKMTLAHARANDELSKLTISVGNWLSFILTSMIELKREDLASAMLGSCGGRPQVQAMPIPSYNNTVNPSQNNLMTQIDAIEPAQYITFLRTLSEECSRIPFANLRQPPSLRRTKDTFCANIPLLCDQLAADLGIVTAEGKAPARSHQAVARPLLVPPSRANTLSQQQNDAFGKSAVSQNAWTQHTGQTTSALDSHAPQASCELADALLGPCPVGISERLAEEISARSEARRAADPSFVPTVNSSVPFPPVTSIGSEVDILARPAELVNFYQKCFSTTHQPSSLANLPSTGGDLRRFDRSVALNLSCSAAFRAQCESKLSQHVIPQSDSEPLVAACVQYYENKCIALSNTLLAAQKHNAVLAEAAGAQQRYADTLQRAIELVKSVAASATMAPQPQRWLERERGQVGPALVSAIARIEGEWGHFVSGNTTGGMTNGVGTQPSSALSGGAVIPPHRQQQQQQQDNGFLQNHVHVQNQNYNSHHFDPNTVPAPSTTSLGNPSSFLSAHANVAATPAGRSGMSGPAAANPFAVSGAVQASPTFAWRN